MTAVEYRKLTFIAWLLAAGIMMVSWGPEAWQGATWQTDDFMRVVQVKDLLVPGAPRGVYRGADDGETAGRPRAWMSKS